MKHVVTCQAKAASDWLTLAAFNCFAEWVGLCAKEGSAHMAKHIMDNPPATPDMPP